LFIKGTNYLELPFMRFFTNYLLTPAFILLFAFSTKTYSQKKVGDIRLGYGLGAGFPFNSVYNYGVNVDGRIQYDISLKTSLTGTTGYTHLFNNGEAGYLGFIPAKLGFKSFFFEQCYYLGEVGAGFGIKKGMGTTFLWAPGIGVATKHVDISLRYENYNKFDTGQVAIRLAYGYKM
jgi:hypothetical protein